MYTATDTHLTSPLPCRPMSYEEKCKLSDDINTLSSEHWAGVMAVIEEEMPQALKNDAEEVELDIDALDIVTLRRLEAFIAECQGKPAVVTVTQAPTATPAVPSPPVPPREPKVKKPKDDEAKQKPKRQPRKKTGPPQSITEETIRETERQLKAVNQSLTTGNASLSKYRTPLG
jgi:outer membrane biosynthesis protein TonB